MAKGTVQKRELTPSEKEAARKLKAAWEDFKAREDNKGVNQEWLGQETGLGNQSLIGQYLGGKIQLNHKALFAICKVIGVRPETISHELTSTLPAKVVIESMQDKPLVYVDPEELKILTFYRQASKSGKRFIFDAALAADKD